MTDQTKVIDTNWESRFSALYHLDDDDWGKSYGQLEDDWREEYKAAFKEIAMERHWKYEDAELWADDLAYEAFTFCHELNYSHQLSALRDIKALEADCEW